MPLQPGIAGNVRIDGAFQLSIDADRVWFTSHLEGAIGMLDTGARGAHGERPLGTLHKYPVPKPDNTWSWWGRQVAGPASKLARFGDALYLSGWADSEVLRFDISMAAGDGCTTLTAGKNPCIDELRIPGGPIDQFQGGLVIPCAPAVRAGCTDTKLYFSTESGLIVGSDDEAGIGTIDLVSWTANWNARHGAPIPLERITARFIKGVPQAANAGSATSVMGSSRRGTGPAAYAGLDIRTVDGHTTAFLADHFRSQLVRVKLD